MAGYNKQLKPGEAVLYEAAISKTARLNALLLLLVILHPFRLMGLSSNYLVVTDQRILGRCGIFGRISLSVPLREVASVQVQRGVLGRLLDYGTLRIRVREGRQVVFRGIVWPLLVKQEIEDAIERAVLGKTLADYVYAPMQPD